MCNDTETPLDSSNSKCENDFITVGELTPYEKGVWKFPNTQLCPLKSCALIFDTRDIAIKHYREVHAKHSVLCKICCYPLMLLKGPHHLATHFARKHPEHQVPPKVKSIKLQCSECNMVYKTFSALQMHEKNVHHKIVNSPRPSQYKVLQVNQEPLVVSSSKQPGEESPSWEDIDTDDSESNKGSPYVPNNPATLVSQKKPKGRKRSNFLTRLIERKPGLFKPRPSAFTCTLCGFRGLKNFVMACSHYRKVHGRNVAMCNVCDRFFTNSVKYIHHMNQQHPRMSFNSPLLEFLPKSSRSGAQKMLIVGTNAPKESDQNKAINKAKDSSLTDKPYQNDQRVSTSGTTGQSEQYDQSTTVFNEKGAVTSDTTENDVILIGEKTNYPVNEYHFPPLLKKCPKIHCHQRFKDRQSIINHYRMNHADHDILCPECNTLIMASRTHFLEIHFNRKHPNCALPKKKTELTACTNGDSDNANGIHNCQIQANIDTVDQSKTNRLPSCRARIIAKPKFGQNAVLHSRVNEKSQSKTNVKLTSPAPATANVAVTELMPNVNANPNLISMVDLSQDDDGFMGPCVENNVSTSEKTTKNTNIICQKKSNHCGKSKQSTSEIPKAKKRNSRSRSIGNRHKACTICGFILSNNVDACDHYHRNHGRNVLICPYCDIFFLQSTLLTKHVLAEHSTKDVYVQMIAEDGVHNPKNNDDAIPTDFDGLNSTEQAAEVVQEQAKIEENLPPVDEPLDLTIQKQNAVIDSTNGALDLRTKKNKGK